MKYWILHSALFLLIASSCDILTDNEDAVAKVGEHTLTIEDVTKSIPDYLDATDSSIWADDYIKSWVQRELLLLKAEEYLNVQMKDVKKELDEYRNSLIIYRFKNEMMKQNMDTTVKAADVQKYFDQYKESFILNRNIVKAVFIKIPIELSNPQELKEMSISSSPEKLAKLNEFCLTYAKAYDRFNDEWVSADRVLKYLPKAISNQQEALENDQFFESKDSEYYYLVCIRDYRIQGQVSPMEYVSKDITNLILSKQKLQFLKQIEKDVYQQGIDKKKVKFYK
jgi:hypothetical protein